MTPTQTIREAGTEILYTPKGAQPMRGYVLGTTSLGRVTIARRTGRWNSKDHDWIIDNVWPSDIATLERQQEPIAYTTQLALRVSNKLAGTPHGVIGACAKNIWGDQGVALYAHPPTTRLSEEVRGLSVEQGKDLLRAINAGAWERIDGALRVNAVSQEHVTQCFKDIGIELEPPF